MTVPRATYRLQFNRNFTLRDAQRLLPYLDQLGVSHIYASPLLMAQPGSPHGYDGCNPDLLNPELGTEQDLELLADQLRARNMGLVLDIVPNHLGISSPQNRWWWDVLKHGQASRFAGHFDIDWKSPKPDLTGKVLVPVLGDLLPSVIEKGEITIMLEGGEAKIAYFEQRFPLCPESIQHWHLSSERALSALNSDKAALHQLLAEQHYLLAFWRDGDSDLNYRRFFNISTLAAIRVDVEHVFRDAHRRVLEWVRRGWVQGFRIDHPDGLYDPPAYLHRLREAAPSTWIVVEKILEPGETLPPAWPVDGTTGYDFISRVSELLVYPLGEQPLTTLYTNISTEKKPFDEIVAEKKRWVLNTLFIPEVRRTATLLAESVAAHHDSDMERLRAAIVEVAAAFPVYRTYLQPGSTPCGEDIKHVETACAAAERTRPDLAASIRTMKGLMLVGDGGEFLMRFQQLTGPAMAKGVEDTAFYCYHRLIALNEVGGNPGQFGLTLEEFHTQTTRMAEMWPHTMLASSTHDTKRSEDVRARLLLLSEIPAEWAHSVQAWMNSNQKHHQTDWPDRNAEYLLYQTLVGAWPISADRAVAYMEKASREAKQHTSWTEPNQNYDLALKNFVEAVLADRLFLESLQSFVDRLLLPGYLNSLSQCLLKLTQPGVPDIYQGTELWDFSLVDPDNRRPVDFKLRQSTLRRINDSPDLFSRDRPLSSLTASLNDGSLKQLLIQRLLNFRRSNETLFRQGTYRPVPVSGTKAHHICAFTRQHGKSGLLVVVPRHPLSLGWSDRTRFLQPSDWGDTHLAEFPGLTGSSLQNIITGNQPSTTGDTPVKVGTLLEEFPVAALRFALA